MSGQLEYIDYLKKLVLITFCISFGAFITWLALIYLVHGLSLIPGFKIISAIGIGGSTGVMIGSFFISLYVRILEKREQERKPW